MSLISAEESIRARIDMDNKLTVLITCKDERKNIRWCVESVRGLADEILVADSGSTDGTLDIVRQIGGCKIITREYKNSYDFRNWAIPQASHPWILVVDADERISPDLSREILQLLATGPRSDGYWVYRDNYFMGHRVRFSGWRSDKVLRFFQRDKARFVGTTDHAQAHISSGKVGHLSNRMIHYTYWTYDQYFQKFHRYTTYQAKVWYDEGRKPFFWRTVLTVPVRFFHSYVIRLGFLDGWVGLQICGLTAFYSFSKQIRLWELHSAVPQPDPELNDMAPSTTTPHNNQNRQSVQSRLRSNAA